MKASFSPQVQRYIAKAYKKNKKLEKLIEKQVKLFEDNPKHPSLRTHKITKGEQDSWSISINMSIRMTYILLDSQTALFVAIGTHEEVYKK